MYEYEDNSFTVINAGSKEGKNIEIFYKGKKITNAISLMLHGAGFCFEEKKLNWRKIIEDFV